MGVESHKAGFVNIIGKPNAGKSTLMNQLVGEKLAIITSKAQTTRHRIMGILNGDDFQIVYSDTPGYLKPEYQLHQSMMNFVRSSLEDADILLLIAGIDEKYNIEELQRLLKKTEAKIIFLLNKTDLSKGSQAEDKMKYWQEAWEFDEMIPISALDGTNVDLLFQKILDYLPDHPPFYPKDELSNRPEKFFAGEIVREKIFVNYQKEVPYSSEVVVTEFTEDENIIRMRAEIYVERDSQKGIIIGNKGKALKKVGTEARMDMEKFFGKKVFLETYVKVEKDWRKKKQKLNRFGYNS
ncbi:GTPase Era [Bacteroidota bacterium]